MSKRYTIMIENEEENLFSLTLTVTPEAISKLRVALSQLSAEAEL